MSTWIRHGNENFSGIFNSSEQKPVLNVAELDSRTSTTWTQDSRQTIFGLNPIKTLIFGRFTCTGDNPTYLPCINIETNEVISFLPQTQILSLRYICENKDFSIGTGTNFTIGIGENGVGIGKDGFPLVVEGTEAIANSAVGGLVTGLNQSTTELYWGGTGAPAGSTLVKIVTNEPDNDLILNTQSDASGILLVSIEVLTPRGK